MLVTTVVIRNDKNTYKEVRRVGDRVTGVTMAGLES